MAHSVHPHRRRRQFGLGEQPALDVVGDFQLGLQPLPFLGDHNQPLQVLRHAIEFQTQLGELVAPADRDAVGEVAPLDSLRALVQLVNRAGNGPANRRGRGTRVRFVILESRAAR